MHEEEFQRIGRRINGAAASSYEMPEFENVSIFPPHRVFLHSEVRQMGALTDKVATKKYEPHVAMGPEVDDDAVFSLLGAPLIDCMLGGGRACCIAYGQTGSGKTHTQTNLQIRAARELFRALETRGEELLVMVSFFENCGDRCYDLLHERHEVQLRDDGTGEVHLAGLRAVPCATVEDVHDALAFGNRVRRTEATAANAQSSRSHSICTLSLHQPSQAADATTPVGSLRIVDLAGSERHENSATHSAERLQEMKEINYSLGCLKECIRSQLLAAKGKKQQHVPYRNSKLTLLLKENLEPGIGEQDHRRTAFIAHVSPMRSSAAHSRNTLDYAAAMIETSRAEQERKKFVGPEQWSKKHMVDWVAQLDGGRFTHLAPSFQMTGKMFAVSWVGELHRRVKAAGGTEADSNFIYDAFHMELKKAKAAQRSRKPSDSSEARTAAVASANQKRKANPTRPWESSGLGVAMELDVPAPHPGVHVQRE